MAKRGGARPGAGRKPKAEKFAGQVVKAEQRCCDRLPTTLDNLEALADGQAIRVECKWELAGLVTVKAPLRDKDGNPYFDAKGKPIMADQLAFPDKPADELVIVERKEVSMGPDYRANEYLANRVLGRPTERVETDVTSNGETVQTVFYIPKNGRDDDPDSADYPAASGASD